MVWTSLFRLFPSNLFGEIGPSMDVHDQETTQKVLVEDPKNQVSLLIAQDSKRFELDRVPFDKGLLFETSAKITLSLDVIDTVARQTSVFQNVVLEPAALVLNKTTNNEILMPNTASSLTTPASEPQELEPTPPVVGAMEEENGSSDAPSFSVHSAFDYAILGGSGDDFLYAQNSGSKLVGNDGDDKLFGGIGEDELIGGNGNDLLSGGAAADAIWGGNGNDIIKAGSGNDTVGGNDGNDLLFLEDGIDTAYGGSGDDEIYGGAGDDFIHGDSGADRLSGGDGNDDLRGGDNADILSGETGNDFLYGEAGDDILYGNAGDDRLDGGDGNDTLSGDEGDDTLNGHNGNDILYGGSGADYMEGHHGEDRLEGGDDNDTLYGHDDNDILRGDGGDDFIDGGHGDDDIQGGFGADVIEGEDGNDVIHLGEGADTVTGGRGADQITAWDGDGARDTFIYLDGDSGPTIAERDVIIGFTSGEDQMDFTGLGAMTYTSFGFLGQGQASFYFDGDIIQIDRDTDGFADMSIEMQFVDTMLESDFLLA